MRVLTGRNVNSLYRQGLSVLAEVGREENSRNGPVLVMPCPVTSVYQNPRERVLIDSVRDANPFFHLYESLWMLSGNDGARLLDRYVKDFSSRYADDGIIHGAYGHRWRTALGFDQLDAVVSRLRQNPDDRQCVIQMWDASDDGLGCNDLRGAWKDRPCNTHVYLRVRDVRGYDDGIVVSVHKVLDLTVLCRSNDIVWGAYGANAVHFSFLLEYLAGRLGVGVGIMYQVSNNYHAYVDTLREPETGPEPYAAHGWSPTSIGNQWDAWDADLAAFMCWHDELWTRHAQSDDIDPPDFQNVWFHVVAAPMAQANWLRRQRRVADATVVVDQIEADDWRAACQAWMGRRAR